MSSENLQLCCQVHTIKGMLSAGTPSVKCRRGIRRLNEFASSIILSLVYFSSDAKCDCNLE